MGTPKWKVIFDVFLVFSASFLLRIIKSIGFAIINAIFGNVSESSKKKRNDGQKYINRVMITKG